MAPPKGISSIPLFFSIVEDFILLSNYSDFCICFHNVTASVRKSVLARVSGLNIGLSTMLILIICVFVPVDLIRVENSLVVFLMPAKFFI